MTRILKILFIISFISPAIGQKIKCSEFSDFFWVIETYSVGEPFISSDTVVIMLELRDIYEDTIQGGEKFNPDRVWDLIWEEDGTLTIIKVDYLKASRGGIVLPKIRTAN